MPQHSLITEQNGTLMEPLIEHQAAVMPQPPQPQEPLAPHNPEPQVSDMGFQCKGGVPNARWTSALGLTPAATLRAGVHLIHLQQPMMPAFWTPRTTLLFGRALR